MREIQPTTIQIKTARGEQNDWCLVHDGRAVLMLREPGVTVTTPCTHVVLVGAKADLDAVIARLGLATEVGRPPRVLVPTNERVP
jgi:hypothetical protein